MSELADTNDGLSLVKRALLEIRRLRGQLAEQMPADAAPVAIIGMAIRFPNGIVRLDDFWQLLAAGEHAITPVPPERWNADGLFDANADRRGKTYSRHGGFLHNVGRFDAAFFGITPREAESMDPQQRILLELTWEALEHAGVAPSGLAGTNAGVFIGLSNSDYGRMMFASAEDIDAYASFGIAASLAAGRISYFLDAHGPSLAVDTACSSSLAAFHLACRSLRSKEASLAIVGAANLMLGPEATISFSHARMLAPDGQCKTFDASANGYVRGEGCAVIILKRLSDAEAAGDRVLAVVRGSAINHDGRSAGLTAPNGPAQEAVIEAALRDARLAPADVDYVEAHGTGTPLGDPIELQALGAAYGKGRPADRPLLIGSVKTNVGHLEAAAGLAGLVKTVLSLQQGDLPPHRNFTAPNPHADWASLPVSVVRSLQPWQRVEQPRRAGLSAFGFSGTNVHVVLEEAPVAVNTVARPRISRKELFVLSARSLAALRELVAQFVEWLPRSNENLTDICYAASAGRAHHPHRLAVVASEPNELAGQLRDWLEGRDLKQLRAVVVEGNQPTIGLSCPLFIASARVYTHALRTASPSFAAMWDSVATAVLPEMLDTPTVESDPAQTFALQYVLGRFLTSLGVTPLSTVGDSEIATASFAGRLAPADALAQLREHTSVPPARKPQQPDRSSRTNHVADTAKVDLLLVLGTAADPAPHTAPNAVAILGASVNAAHTGLLEALKAIYLAGADLVWDALYRGESLHKPDLPTYPFQRQHFWHRSLRQNPLAEIGRTHPAVTSIQPASVNWPKLIATTAAQSQNGPLGWDITKYSMRWERCDDLVAGHAVNTLITLGAFAQPGASATPDELVRRHKLVPLYRNLVWRWLSLLARQGILYQEGDTFVSPLPLQRRDLTHLWPEVEQLLADEPDILGYAKRTSAKLLELLTGKFSPLEVLFPRGSLDTAEGIYGRSQAARYLNSIVSSAVHSALGDHRNGPFRLVEVGAGTGGTTAGLMPFFPADGEYWFTDLSDIFLARARARFGGNAAFRFTKFDLDQPPTANLPIGQSDVIVAANVVHATKDVGVALDHLRMLLKPGGLLILVENTTHHSLFDLTIAFIEGWSAFADNYRTRHPLLEADRWTSLLRDRGFVEAERFPPTGSVADSIGQHVLVARNNLQMPAMAMPATSLPAPQPAAPTEPGSQPHVFQGDPQDPDYRERLSVFVRQCAANVMHLDPVNRPGPRERFTDIGMDSLMAVQLKADLVAGLGLDEQQLPSTIAFDAGTVQELTDQIMKLMAPAIATTAEHEPPGMDNFVPGDLTIEDLNALSETEIEALLAQRVVANEMLVKL